MRILSFKQRYNNAILAGTKTTTMRRADSPTTPRPGEIVQFRNGRYRAPFAHARITATKIIRVAGITDSQARADGFATASELRAQLNETYGPIQQVVVISFELTTPPQTLF